MGNQHKLDLGFTCCATGEYLRSLNTGLGIMSLLKTINIFVKAMLQSTENHWGPDVI